VHIVVCIKQVLDQEIPPQAFRVDRAARRPDLPRAALVMSIFDANALELALQLREAAKGSTITALSAGTAKAEEVLRKAYAVTVDRAVLLSDPAFQDLDSAGMARFLAAAVRKLEPAADLVLCGRQAGDVENGQVGTMLAAALGWPCLTFVARLAVDGTGLRAHRQVDDGHEVYQATTPLVCTVTNDRTSVLRHAKVRDVMQANRKPVTVWDAADVGAVGDSAESPACRLVEATDLYIPDRQSNCELIEGETAADKARTLVRRLRDLGVL